MVAADSKGDDDGGRLDLVGTVLAVLRLPNKTLESHALGFLRIRNRHGKPNGRMPTWRWLCSVANHDTKETLLGESARLRSLICR